MILPSSQKRKKEIKLRFLLLSFIGDLEKFEEEEEEEEERKSEEEQSKFFYSVKKL